MSSIPIVLMLQFLELLVHQDYFEIQIAPKFLKYGWRNSRIEIGDISISSFHQIFLSPTFKSPMKDPLKNPLKTHKITEWHFMLVVRSCYQNLGFLIFHTRPDYWGFHKDFWGPSTPISAQFWCWKMSHRIKFYLSRRWTWFTFSVFNLAMFSFHLVRFLFKSNCDNHKIQFFILNSNF